MLRRTSGAATANTNRASASSGPVTTVWRTRVPPTSGESSSVPSKRNGPDTDRTTCLRGGVRSTISYTAVPECGPYA